MPSMRGDYISRCVVVLELGEFEALNVEETHPERLLDCEFSSISQA